MVSSISERFNEIYKNYTLLVKYLIRNIILNIFVFKINLFKIV
jgi:hypothetical protein